MRTRFAKEYVISSWVLAAALLCSTAIVFADTASTSVTVGNSAPTISALSFHGGTNLTLSENTFVRATSTMTVTDANGCSSITGVTAKFYLASTTNSGSACTYNGNNCYTQTSCVATTTGNTCTGGGDTSVQYDCGFQVWYNAEATQAGAPTWASSIWSSAATATDASAGTGTATNTTETIEVNTLASLNVTASIAYGSVAAGADTAASNQTVTSTNTGNISIDNEISGDLMCTDYSTCAGGVMQPAQQKYGLTNVTYASLASTLAATTSPVRLEMTYSKPTATTSAVTENSYWGIAIPAGQAPGSYTGQNTISAIAD